MSASLVLANYEALAALTRQIHESAMRCDWERLISIGQERSRLVEAMKPLDAKTTLDGATLDRKNLLITEILAADTEICDAVQSWMDQFQLGMQSSLQELRLLKEYGA